MSKIEKAEVVFIVVLAVVGIVCGVVGLATIFITEVLGLL